ncbi:MAG: late competence development ComFB family protein [Spirochaetales bacterium]|nr:late competence development ComFB family protein [Spirochaetales bacterium]
MKIHNLLEDIVSRKVDELFGDEQITQSLGICTCDQCRLDVICYALNRLSPRYIVSGRGASHIEAEFNDDYQNVTDIASVVNEGINKVRHLKRPACSADRRIEQPPGPVYNFPSITGKIFDGDTFEPLSHVLLHLYCDDVPVEMMNSNWTNPYEISPNTPGTFSFWPKPVAAQSQEEKKFSFEIRIDSGKDAPHSHFFTIHLRPDNQIKEVFELITAYKVDDIYIFD